MIACAGRCSQVPEAEVRVARHGCDEAVGVRAPLCRVGAAVGWKGKCAAFSLGIPNFDGAVPGGRGEGGFGGEVPGAGKGFAGMFGECRNRKVGLECGVEESEGAITAGCQKLRRMQFGMGDIVECILSRIPLHRLNTLRRQLQHIEPAIADESEICSCCYRNAIVEKR